MHGESTVCASVDVRQHHPVRMLMRSHLQQAQACLHSGSGIQGPSTLRFNSYNFYLFILILWLGVKLKGPSMSTEAYCGPLTFGWVSKPEPVPLTRGSRAFSQN